MSLLRRMLDAFTGVEDRAVNQIEGGGGWAHGLSASGYAVSAHLAENLSGAVACVNAVASGLATLPAYV